MLQKETMPDLLKIDRNHNFPVAPGKATCVSRLTWRGVPIALPSFEQNPEVCLGTRQESLRR